MAEEERFELSIRITPYDELATRSFKPLTHSSWSIFSFLIMKEIPVATRQPTCIRN
jgi:hypothetical protein